MKPDKFKKLSDAVEGYTTLELFEEAQKLLDELPPKFKITKEVIRLHMTLLAKQKEYHKASFLAETLSLFEPENVEGLLMVASYRYKAGAFDEALEFMQSSPAAIWDHWAAWVLLAEIQLRRGCKEEARKALKKCVELAPERRMEILDAMEFDGLW